MLFNRKQRTPLSPNESSEDNFPTIAIEIHDESLPTNQFEISVLDINASGMGITCEIPLNVGQQVVFTNDQLEWDLPEQGVVMWTFKANDGFRAGIKFL